MVHILWLSTKYVAHFDSSSWRCVVDRDCGDTKWIPHGAVLADWKNTRTDKSCCLQLDSGRSLNQIIRDFLSYFRSRGTVTRASSENQEVKINGGTPPTVSLGQLFIFFGRET